MQETALRSMPDVVVATPGRMIDHLRNSMSVDLEDLAVLILDEADRLLELGFNAEIRELVSSVPILFVCLFIHIHLSTHARCISKLLFMSRVSHPRHVPVHIQGNYSFSYLASQLVVVIWRIGFLSLLMVKLEITFIYTYHISIHSFLSLT